MVQIGTVDDEEKPKFASLPQDLQIESVTLDRHYHFLNYQEVLVNFKVKIWLLITEDMDHM